MNAVKEDVIQLIEKELEFSMTKYPLFGNEHEAYGVIKEEFEETFDELTNMQAGLALFWDGIKKNNEHIATTGVQNLYYTSMATAIEAIQVAAMCLKYGRSRDVIVDRKYNTGTTDLRYSSPEHEGAKQA